MVHWIRKLAYRVVLKHSGRAQYIFVGWLILQYPLDMLFFFFLALNDIGKKKVSILLRVRTVYILLECRKDIA